MLYMIAMNPELADPVRNALIQGRDPASLTIKLDPEGKVSFSVADIRLSLPDLEALQT